MTRTQVIQSIITRYWLKSPFFAYNNMHVCISLQRFFNKAYQLTHIICMSRIILRVINNAFQLAYTMCMLPSIGLRPFNGAYQFQFANV